MYQHHFVVYFPDVVVKMDNLYQNVLMNTTWRWKSQT